MSFVVDPEATGSARGDVCVFDTWVGDDLVRAHPLILVTTALRRDLQRKLPPAVFRARRVRVQASAFFRTHRPGVRLPVFWALEIAGRAGVDDLGIGSDGGLVASLAALAIFSRHRIHHALIRQRSNR